MDPTETTAFDSTVDISAQLMQRYSSSSAPQHRHLTATSAAIKSLLLEDSLPLTPLSYFAAVMTALSQPLNDAASASALATLLSIVLPLLPERSIAPDKAVDAVAVLVRVSESDEREMLVGSASSARCVVKALGVLLGFCDLNDWNSVKLGFSTLLKWCMDKRPKVRKCALVYLENGLKLFLSKSVKRKASKLVMSLLETHMSIACKLGVLQNGVGYESERQCEAEESGVVHALNVVRVALPYLSEESSKQVILKLIELLSPFFSTVTRPVLNAIETFLEKVEVGIVNEVAEDIIVALSPYVSSKTNPKDSIISAANVLKVSLDKLYLRDHVKWFKCLPIGIKAIAGLLVHEDDIASKSSIIMKNLIVDHLGDLDSHTTCNFNKNDEASKSVASICSTFMELLTSFSGIPNEHTLAVLSVLFLKFGHNSFSYMKDIVLKLAEVANCVDGTNVDTNHLEFCFGCAVVAMGAENILSLVPISFNVAELTYTNMWMLPILKKYTIGSSLRCFMELIAPIAQSLQKASRKVKKSGVGQDQQAHAIDLWGLLPAFCRYPTDIKKNFHSFVKLMLFRLKKDAFIHEYVAEALQELIMQNNCLLNADVSIVEPIKHKSDLPLEDHLKNKKNLFFYSKKMAIKNIKAMSSFSDDLLQALISIFLDSPLEKRSSLKKAISCLASITNSSVTKKIFLSSLERFPVVKAASAAGDFDPPNSVVSDAPLASSSIDENSQWSLILDLASSIVEGADEDLIGVILRLTKNALKVRDGLDVAEAYNALSCVLEAHPQCCSIQMDELVDFIVGLKSPADIASFSNRLSSLHLLLVHALKSSADAENTKAFLILNEIIVALKDSREEARKTAYDILLKISACLEDSSASVCGPYYKLISMIMGYLSGPSPHIISAAVSALSVLVFKDPELCVKVPDVVSSVSSLLQSKAVETIKAVLGFIKVLVSCLEAKDLQDIVQVIVDGVIPWSSVSRHHFRSKVTVILEILIRKLGLPAIKSVTPERFHSFVRKVSQNHHGKTTSKEADSSDKTRQLANAPRNGPRKRSHKETNADEAGSGPNLQRNKKRKQVHDSESLGSVRKNTGVKLDKKNNHFKNRKSKFSQNKRQNFGQSSKNTQTRHGRKYGHNGRSRQQR